MESSICNDPDLSELDDLLSVYYKNALVNSNINKDFKTTQRDWIKQRNNCANDNQCITNAYVNRIKELAIDLNLLNPDDVINPQLFTAAHVLEPSLAGMPSCGSFEDINLDGVDEVICTPDCNGAPACGDYFFASNAEKYRYLPELSMGSYNSLLILKSEDNLPSVLEQQPGYQDYKINGWRILYSTYGYINDCIYSATYYGYSKGAYHELFAQSLEPPWNSCQ